MSVKSAGRKEGHHNTDINQVCHKQPHYGTPVAGGIIKTLRNGIKTALK
jgi:hypothetical protein